MQKVPHYLQSINTMIFSQIFNNYPATDATLDATMDATPKNKENKYIYMENLKT